MGVVLSRTKILETAFGLLSTYGLADLSMRRLAAELQVAPGALYYHVQSKQNLLTMLADYIFAQAPQHLYAHPSDSSPSAGRLIISRCEGLFLLLYPVRDCPDVIRLALTLHPQRIAPIRAIALDLEAAGYSPQHAQRRARLIMHIILGLVEEAQTLPLITERAAQTAAAAGEVFQEDIRVAVDSLAPEISVI